MTPDGAINVMQEALWITVLLAAVPLLAALGIGLLVAVFQAATQINEMTLSFVPKLLVMALAMLFAGHWMLGLIIDYTQRLMTSIPSMLG
ncbi:MAG: flagellar biosynthesis protein FliQ [Chromatiales bacterium]|nr:flagellar biosynthesis protein FliQ [Gammaproteobacteria bacterium]MCP5352798.1 flagellar biosynthesis protein FliQ [Chromatiales bacterium]